ncbi:MAG: diaminopimelate epimerase [Egibacteraceae bacterium]
MRFVKVHGAGNDFVLIPDLEDRITLTPPFVRAVCAQHTGLGADGVIRVAPPGSEREGDVFMDYWNADGSIAEMCGNGVRCVAKYVMDRRMVGGGSVEVSTRAGVKLVRIIDRWGDGTVATVAVDMGIPRLSGERQVDVSPTRLGAPEVPGHQLVTLDHVVVTVTTLSMGNPHAVVLVDDVARAPVASWGPVIERDGAFPQGTNVEFIAVEARDHVVGRIWERGVGETLASGTGASAMAVAAHALGLADQRVQVDLPGGMLEIDWTGESVWVKGPAAEVATGEFDRGWLDANLPPFNDRDDAS